MDIREAIGLVITGIDLDETQMLRVMHQIMSGEATPAQIGSFITALRMKGETVAEIVGAVKVMRDKATKIDAGVLHDNEVVLDTCGTGGDGSGTFNVSTASAFVAAGAGITVAKHGNRSISSKCGSADVLEATGVKLDLTSVNISRCVKEVGIGFLFAPALHGAMKYAIGPRKEIGVRTIFNILGPLTNPAGANVQVLGVFDKELVEPLAKVLGKLGTRRALVVHGEGNLDELTVTGSTHVCELRDGDTREYLVTPEDVGLRRCRLQDLKGGETANESAEQLKEVLAGQPGPKRDMVLLNSGASLLVSGVCDTLEEGVRKAGEVIDGGHAKAKLDELVRLSQQLSVEQQ